MGHGIERRDSPCILVRNAVPSRKPAKGAGCVCVPATVASIIAGTGIPRSELVRCPLQPQQSLEKPRRRPKFSFSD